MVGTFQHGWMRAPLVRWGLLPPQMYSPDGILIVETVIKLAITLLEPPITGKASTSLMDEVALPNKLQAEQEMAWGWTTGSGIRNPPAFRLSH